MKIQSMTTDKKVPSLLLSSLPIFFLIACLTINVTLYAEDSSSGPNQIALLLAAAFSGILGLRLGYKWEDLQDGMVESINSAMVAILIILMIGALSGTWLISGVVPVMIYYGLEILDPAIFLFAACMASAIVSLATGSSWTTVATIGIALIGIGKVMGISEGIVAGAVISGAYFGDKMSPLSDTTNLAPAMAGTDLFTHIRYMTLTTGPSILITLIVFLVWGFTLEVTTDVRRIVEIQQAIATKFNIHLGLFLVPVGVVFLIVKKVPALPVLLTGSLLGGVFALIFQPGLLNDISGITDSTWKSGYVAVMQAMFTDTSITTGNAIVDDLLTASGMKGMLNTVWLVVTAMVFGGVMECTGMLRKIAHSIIKRVKSTGSLVASTATTCITFNVTASDQYIAVVVPGKMFASTYRERGLAPENLSRTLEDSGTVTSALIPWNTCGAYHSGVLGVATLSYLPYCFFNIISPLMTITYAYLNIKIRRLNNPETLKQMFKKRITGEEINELPLDGYKGKYTLITSSDQLEKAFTKINQHRFVGFDTETKPTFKKGHYQAVAMIQIGIPEEVFLIRINQTGLHDQIISFFENERIRKVGVALADDIKDLQKVKNFNPAGLIDLSEEVKQIGIESNGLRKLTAIMLGFRISKNAQVSNWEAAELTEKQLRYAATDAWVCLEMYKKLLSVI